MSDKQKFYKTFANKYLHKYQIHPPYCHYLIKSLYSECICVLQCLSYSAGLYLTLYIHNTAENILKENHLGGCQVLMGLGTPGPCLGAGGCPGAALASALASALQ